MSEDFELPPLKRPPAYGVYRWWPQDGEDWIHPFDIGMVRQLIPGTRVFRREDLDGAYLLVSYGDIRFRVKSTIWYEVDFEGFNVGDYVEIKSRMGKADPFIGQIKEMVWSQRYARIEYYLVRNHKSQVKAYLAEDITLTDAVEKLQPEEHGQIRYNHPGSGGSLPKS